MRELFICAGGNEGFSFATPVGIGLVDASIGLSTLLSRGGVGRLIFIGSCGLYDTKLPLLDIYQASHAANTELASLVGNFYSPLKLSVPCGVKCKPTKEQLESEAIHVDAKDARANSLMDEVLNIRSLSHGGFPRAIGVDGMDQDAHFGRNLSRAFDPTSEAAFAKMSSTNSGEVVARDDEEALFSTIPSYKVNSSNYICQDANAAKVFLKHGYILENMEAYAIAQCAKHFNVEVHLIFCATNYCDENAHETFRKNHNFAKKTLMDFVHKNFIV